MAPLPDRPAVTTCYNRGVRRVSFTASLSLLSTALVLPLVAAADPPDEEPEVEVTDLATLTRIAERTYPSIRAAQARILAAQAQLDEAWVSPFFQSTVIAGASVAPQIHGSPIYSNDQQVPLTNPWAPILGIQVQGAIPLWTFGKLPAARDAARAGIRAAHADQARTRAQLRYDIRRAYFALQLALDLRQMVNESLPQMREAAAHIDEQLEEGDTEVSQLDRWRMQAALAEVEARASDVQRLEATARAALGTLTGRPRVHIPECPIEPVELDLDPLDHYVRQAREGRPEVRMLEAAVNAREAAVRVAEAGFFPDFGFAYRIGQTWAPGMTNQTNPFVIDPANYTTVQAGLVMRWSLDVWGNAYRLNRANAQLDDTRAQTEMALGGIGLEVAQAYSAVQAAQAHVETWARGRRETRAWFIAAAQGREVGTVEPRDLVDAVRAYLTARYSHLSAIHDLNSAAANLERTSGTQVVRRWEPPCE